MPEGLNATALVAQNDQRLEYDYIIKVNGVEIDPTHELIRSYTFRGSKDSQMNAQVSCLNKTGAFSSTDANSNLHNGSGTVSGLVVGGWYYFEQGTAGHNLTINSVTQTSSTIFKAGATTGTISSGDSSDIVRKIGEGDSVQIIEIINSQEFSKFYGHIDRVYIDKSRGTNYVTWECLDILKYLEFLDCDVHREGTQADSGVEQVDPDSTVDSDNFFATISSVTSTKIVYASESNEDQLLAGSYNVQYRRDILYNFTRRTTRKVSGISTSTKTLTTDYRTDSWQAGDVITNKIYHHIFNLDNTDIDTRTLVLTYKNLSTNQDEPNTSDIDVDRDTGQVIVAGGLNITNFALYASYKYYTAGLHIEDEIEYILTQTDGYGSTPITSSNLQTTYQAVEGSGNYDTLTVDASNPNLWYFKYDNIVTDLDNAGNFTVSGGLYVSDSFDARTGTITTTGSPANVSCGVNYTFKTLQATGIEIPYVWFDERTTTNRIDAIKQLLATVAPNYKLFTRGTNHIWGKYLRQKTAADSELYNPVTLRYFPDEDVYTRVKLYSKNTNPRNLVGEGSLAFVGAGEEKATDVTLTFTGYSGDYAVFAPPIRYPISQNPETPIELKFSGSQLSGKAITVYEDIEFSNWEGPNSDGIYWYRLNNKNVINSVDTTGVNNSVNFYTNEIEKLDIFVTNVDSGNGIVYVRASFIEIDEITNVDYQIQVSSEFGSDYYVDYQSTLFYINKNYFVNGPEAELVTATYYYFKVDYVGAVQQNILGDGSPYTQISFNSHAEPVGADAFIIALKENSTIDSIDLAAGYFYPRENQSDVRKYNTQMTLSIKYSEDVLFSGTVVGWFSAARTSVPIYWPSNRSALSVGDTLVMDGEEMYVSAKTDNGAYVTVTVVRGYNGTTAKDHSGTLWTGEPIFHPIYTKITYSAICTELTEFDISTGSYVAVSREALGETFKAATFKIIVDKCSAITYRSWAGDRDLSIYSVALHTFRAYANSVIKSEATLVAGTPSTDLEIQDDLGLLEKIGDRVYKMEFDEKTILSQDNLDTLAYNLLSEFYKKHTQLRVQELYNPELEMGLTMEVVDTLNGIDQNYFIEEFGSTRSGNKITHDLLLARYP